MTQSVNFIFSLLFTKAKDFTNTGANQLQVILFRRPTKHCHWRSPQMLLISLTLKKCLTNMMETKTVYWIMLKLKSSWKKLRSSLERAGTKKTHNLINFSTKYKKKIKLALKYYINQSSNKMPLANYHKKYYLCLNCCFQAQSQD